MGYIVHAFNIFDSNIRNIFLFIIDGEFWYQFSEAVMHVLNPNMQLFLTLHTYYVSQWH